MTDLIHPDDRHLLDDWFIYGPRDSEIAEIVRDLVSTGIRVENVEQATKLMFQNWKNSVIDSGSY